ncbi:glycine oxidase ThiO [bacterium]|nr:glycine oxidase ThiO [bacterium]
MPDVLVIGGGVIGLSVAFELAGQGLKVTIVDQSGFGQEASWAGAGMLPPGRFTAATTTEARLRSASHALWPIWQEQLTQQTGIDVGYRRCGAIDLAESPEDPEYFRLLDAYRAEQIPFEVLAATDLRQRFAYLNRDIPNGCWVPDYAQVRNPWLVRALIAGCQQRGVNLQSNTPVTTLEVNADRVASISTAHHKQLTADRYIITSGAWSQRLLQPLRFQLPLEPVRGQIVLLQEPVATFQHIIQVGPRYLVPRGDGRILIGSTEEHVGFEKQNTEAGVQGLLDFAYQLVPALRSARIERTWAGLRPWKPGGLPFIGPIPEFQNLWLAAGHFRAGLQLSPITAVLLRQALLGQPTTIDLAETSR